jgi:hypothetical protein
MRVKNSTSTPITPTVAAAGIGRFLLLVVR